MGYYDNYLKRVNRYGNTLQERIQGKREHDFEVFMKKSPNQVDAWNDLVEGEPYNAILQTKEYDQDEVVDYLLVPLENEIPMGTIIYTKDARHKQVTYEDKVYPTRRWINYAIDPYTSSGYNRYTVVELESELSWVDEGIKYTAFAHATGGGSGARDKNINLKFSMQFSEAGVYLPNKRYSIIMPTHPNIKKNMKVTLGEETWRVTGFDSISVKGVSYVTLEETLTDKKEDLPIANASQLNNWTVTTSRGDNFTIMRDSTNELELFFFYNNEPQIVSYTILKNSLYSISQENNKIFLKTTHTQGDTSLKVVIEGWDENNYLEIPFSIKDYSTSPLKMIGPSAVYMGETAKYTIKNVDKNGYDAVKLKNNTATLVSKTLNEETGDLSILVLGNSIGKNQVVINDYSFDFEIRSLWLGGDD
jgi:hypothetical protein